VTGRSRALNSYVDNETGADLNTCPFEAKYANYFQTGYNTIEFLIEFGQSYGEEPKPLLHTRIVTTPGYAKHLLTLLENTLRKYEAEHGRIEEL
jgi:hypothetical protein